MIWFVALLGSVAIIVIGIYRKMNTGLAMLFGALMLGFLSGLPVSAYLAVISRGLWNHITIMLVLSIIMLGVLGHVLKETGALEEIVINLRALAKDVRIITAAMPMLIGMLTVPGGAVLSAPLCSEAGKLLDLPPLRQAVINNWFRHVGYFIFPLFPSLIITAELSGVGLGLFFFHNLPLTIIGTVFGFYYLFRGFSSYKVADSHSSSWHHTALLVRSIMPLLLILFLVLFLNLYFPFALMAGILIALLNFLPDRNRFGTFIFRLKTMITGGIKIPVALVIVGIMIYKEMLSYTGVISTMTEVVINTGMPIIFLIALISFLVGILTGDNAASMAILVPLFLPLIPGHAYVYSAYFAFLYAGSTCGHIISPAHPCFSLTKEYYEVDIRSFVVLSLPLLAVVMTAGFIITLFFGYY